MPAKAPTLAWLQTVLTCFLAGLALAEGRHQAVAFPHPEGPRPTVGVVVTVEVRFQSTATPAPTARPTSPQTSPPTPWPNESAISPRPEDCVVMVCADGRTPAPTDDDLIPRRGSLEYLP
jgi:hypothetical protein